MSRLVDAVSVEEEAWRPGSIAAAPPAWLVAATAILTLICLALAVAETTLWTHYLIDEGEFVALIGLVFISAAGVHLFLHRRLLVSLPLALPWLIYPVITQGDQLIDNLSMNQMRLVTHVLLALLFGAPVAVAVLAARLALAPGERRTLPRRHWTGFVPGLRAIAEGHGRLGRGIFAAALFAGEILIAHQFLGLLMVITLVLMILAALVHATRPEARLRRGSARSEKVALAALAAGVLLSLGLYTGARNRPGAYQGSPAYYMDPSQKDAAYRLEAIVVPAGAPVLPEPPVAADVRLALSGYARAMHQLLEGYYIADRNYNYAFHNALFMRNTPVLPDFRRVALTMIDDAARIAGAAEERAVAARGSLAPDNPLTALLDDVRGYAAFNFRRAGILERKTADFERTEAGLQHATHIYEGEGKALGAGLDAIVRKHRAVTESPRFTAVTGEFLAAARAISARYSNRIVGF